MTIEELELVLTRVRYKEGFTIKLERLDRYRVEPTENYFIRIGILVNDVDHPRLQNYINGTVMIDPQELKYMPVKVLMLKIFNSVLDAEQHEVKEWLKYDGVSIVDPHPETRIK